MYFAGINNGYSWISTNSKYFRNDFYLSDRFNDTYIFRWKFISVEYGSDNASGYSQPVNQHRICCYSYLLRRLYILKVCNCCSF